MDKQKRQIVISAACALLAATAVFGYTATVRSEASTQRAAALERFGGEQIEIPVAVRDVQVGEPINSSNVEMRTWLVDLLPSTAAATSFEQVDGRVAQTDIKENEPVLLERVGDSSSRISVPDGLEAVTVSSDDVLAVGGAIAAGSLVDVYVETSEGKVVLLGQKILVLETSGGVEKQEQQLTWVTLAVTSESVSELLSASVKGTIHLVLPGASAVKGGKDARE